MKERMGEIEPAAGRAGRVSRAFRDRFTADERARALKERVYATLTGLAVVVVYAIDPAHALPSGVWVSLATGIAGIAAAGFMAELIAHLMAHPSSPTRAEVRTMARIAVGALASASLPLLVLTGAVIGVLPLPVALWLSAGLYLLILGAIVLIAARRRETTWRRRVVSVILLVAFGGVVVLTLALAHGG